jgi:hypothetical protein
MLGWVAQAFEPKPDPTLPDNGLSEPGYPETKPEQIPERIKPAHQDRDSSAETAEPKQDYKPEETKPEPIQILPSETFLPDKPEREAETLCKDSVHFLLMGRPWEEKKLKIIMMVTLLPDRSAILTTIDRYYPVVYNGSTIPLGRVLAEGGGYADLSRFAAEIADFKPSFYIDLNSHGFVEILNLIGGIDHAIYVSLDRRASGVIADTENLCGAALLEILEDPSISTAEKERLIIALLLTTRNIHNTTRELSLLWSSYRNIKTNLRLNDLLKIRGVALEICPTQVHLREIDYP